MFSLSDCYFLENLINSACSCAMPDIAANLEDYNPEEHLPGYVSCFNMFPKQSEKLQIRIEEHHQSEFRLETHKINSITVYMVIFWVVLFS